jgi:hypothetical protein
MMDQVVQDEIAQEAEARRGKDFVAGGQERPFALKEFVRGGFN